MVMDEDATTILELDDEGQMWSKLNHVEKRCR